MELFWCRIEIAAGMPLQQSNSEFVVGLDNPFPNDLIDSLSRQ